MFGKGKEKKQEKKQKEKKKSKDGGGLFGGILGKVGVDVEKDDSVDEAKIKERRMMIFKTWEWVRKEVDRGSQLYLQNGDPAVLQEYVARPAYDAMIAHLDSLAKQGILWAQPERKIKTEAKLEFVSEKLNSQDQPIEFIVRERFRDFSVYRTSGGDVVAPGREHVIQGKIEVKNGDQFKLISVTEIKEASL
jgi:hypothetical protein